MVAAKNATAKVILVLVMHDSRNWNFLIERINCSKSVNKSMMFVERLNTSLYLRGGGIDAEMFAPMMADCASL